MADLEQVWTFHGGIEPSAEKVAREDDEPKKTRKRSVTTNRLADLLTLIAGIDALRQWASAEAADDAPPTDGDREIAALNHITKVEPLLVKFADQIEEGFQNHFSTMASELSLGPRFDQAMRPTSPVGSVHLKAQFLRTFLPKAKAARTPLIRQVFAGRASTSVMRTAKALEADSPAAALHELAQNVPVSGLQISRKWVQKAAEIVGVPITQIESQIADAQVAASLGKELKQVDAALAAADPTAAETPDLAARKAEVLTQIEAVAEASSDPSAVRAAAVAEALPGEYAQTTKIGQKLGMSEEQEQAMLVRGQNVIAAGAGSGKTRVLSGKVVYHMTESDPPYPAHRIMGVSFTRASSNELVERIMRSDDGRLKSDKEAANGFGSTHSVAGKLRRLGGRKWERQGRLIKDAEQSWLMRCAILQVMQNPSSDVAGHDPDESFFPNRPDRVHWEEGGTASGPAKDEILAELDNASSKIEGYIRWAARENRIAEARARWAKGWLSALRTRVQKDEVAGLSDLSPTEQRILYHVYTTYAKLPVPIESPAHKVVDKLVEALRNANSFLSWAKGARLSAQVTKAEDSIALIKNLFQKFDTGEYTTWKDLDSVEKKGVIKYWGGKGSPWKMPGTPPAAVRKAAGFPAGSDKLFSASILNALEEKFPAYAKRPANQWFNLGLPATAFMEPEPFSDAEPTPDNPYAGLKPRSMGEFALYITGSKGRLKAPGKAYAEDTAKAKPRQQGMGGAEMVDPDEEMSRIEHEMATPGVEAAVYAAYEFLLHQDGDEDFDDVLIQASRMLIEEPSVLARVNERYKVVLVDEAQDLNPSQHVLFGLVAGQIDPRTVEPREDCEMTADTFSFIGDDKQSIYGFRGAEVEEFVGKTRDCFKTKLLTMNYRSGSAIVQAANNLMRVHEEAGKQIPMECLANVERKGEGRIVERVLPSPESLSVYVADVIADDCQGDAAEGSYDDYGLLVRTRKEAMEYGVSMVERGIPFRSKHNFFKGPAVVTLIGLMRLANAKEGDTETINEVVATAHKALNFQLGATFPERLEERAGTGNWLKYLQGGGWDNIYGGRAAHRNDDFVKPYTDFLTAVQKQAKKEKLTTMALIDFAMKLETPQGSMIERLMERVKASKEQMEEVLNEYENTDDESIEQYARGEIAILEAMAEHHNELSSAVSYINVMQGRAEELAVGDDERSTGDVMKGKKPPPPAVRVDTVHGWKGLEAKHVFVPMWEGRFPHIMTEDDGSRTGGKEMEAERRLAYVAITRGEDSVTIIRPARGPQVSETKPPKPILPSRFVGEACITNVGATASVEDPPDIYRDPEYVLAFLQGDKEFERVSCGPLADEWTYDEDDEDEFQAEWFKTNEELD